MLIGLRGLYNEEVVKLRGFLFALGHVKKKKRKAKVGDPVGRCPREAS